MKAKKKIEYVINYFSNCFYEIVASRYAFVELCRILKFVR